MEETKRTFISLELPEEVKQAVLAEIEKLKEKGVKAVWTRPENHHLTLKFLGKTPVDQIEGIGDNLNLLAQSFSSFQVELKGIGGFPNSKRPRVIWMGVGEGKEKIVDLVEKLESSLSTQDFKKEERDFKPHLTLGRIRLPKTNKELEQEIEACQEKCFGKWTVEKLSFIKSTLHAEGAIHEVIHEAGLKSI